MQLVIHAGVAFTDEGRLLQSLQANGRVFSKNGVDIPRPRRFKHSVWPVLQSLWTEPPSSALHEQLRRALPNNPDVKRTMLSSDEILGGITEAIHEGQFYPLAGQRLAYIDEVLQDTQIELFLAVRNPGVFIPKVLMSLTEDQRRAVFENTDLSCLSWLSMIEDIRDLAPNVKMTLWSNEDTPLIWGDILRLMGGFQDDVAFDDEYGLLSSLLRPTGQREVLSLIRQDPTPEKEDLRKDLSRILKDFAEPDKIEEEIELPGWSDDILSAFSELYEQDLAQIANMPEVRFLKP
ncbi:hypothetical protein [Ruegeria arenilitoris]|uniref:hypothetical protein n=1 Tax=Ruegeria arenilitoris TaxID=1173585 RepID=UPI001480785D|nr:hypothetical protein [Ruegeria arenilitoris]